MPFEVERFANHLLEGDQYAAWDEITHYLEAGLNSLYIYHQVITRAMEHIGTLWEKDIITVADEHLATSVCDVLLTRFDHLLTPPPGRSTAAAPPRVMLFCLEKERHSLGIKMLASLFKQAGWEVHLLGPDLPLEFALMSAAKWKPDVIALSVSIFYHLPQLKSYIESLEKLEHRPTVMVGGRLAGLYDLSSYGSDRTLLFRDLPEVYDWLQGYRHEEDARATS